MTALLRRPSGGRLPGRLAPGEMYPARDPRVRASVRTLRSGLQVRVIEAGPEDGPPVLFLHGWGASAFTWRRNVPVVADAGYRVAAVDLKGHGLSSKPLGAGEYTLEALLDHVTDVMHALGFDRPAVVAQSMAGAIALELALSAVSRVSRLALLAPVGLRRMSMIPLARALTPRHLDEYAPLLVARWGFAVGLRLIYGNPRLVTERDVDEYWAPTQFPEYARVLRALVHEFRWPPIEDTRLASLRVPTLVVLGARDRVVWRADVVAKRLPGARLEVVRGAGHAVNEERAELVNARLVEFLRETD